MRLAARPLWPLAGCLLLLGADARSGTLTSEADLGATIFLGKPASYAAPGPAFGARLGYSPTRWLTLGAFVGASTHEATVPPPPAGELFQLYLIGADVRFTARAGRLGLFAESSGGVAFISTNVLDAVAVTEPGRKRSPYLLGGGGIELHTDNPRFAFGLAGDYCAFPDFNFLQSVSARVYLRYSK